MPKLDTLKRAELHELAAHTHLQAGIEPDNTLLDKLSQSMTLECVRQVEDTEHPEVVDCVNACVVGDHQAAVKAHEATARRLRSN